MDNSEPTLPNLFNVRRVDTGITFTLRPQTLRNDFARDSDMRERERHTDDVHLSPPDATDLAEWLVYTTRGAGAWTTPTQPNRCYVMVWDAQRSHFFFDLDIRSLILPRADVEALWSWLLFRLGFDWRTVGGQP